MSGDFPNNRVLREAGPTGSYEDAQNLTDATVDAYRAAAARKGTGGSAVRGETVLAPYTRRPLMAGDPASASGVKVAESELDAALAAKINSGSGSGSIKVREADGSPVIDPTTTIVVPNSTLSPGAPGEAVLDMAAAVELREVVLGPFQEVLAPGTTINIQTGVYVGAFSPVARKGDLNVTLPLSGAAFMDDGRIEVHKNGQELTKGNGTGNGVAEWVSATQIKLNMKVKVQDEILVRAPFPTA